MTPEGQVKVKVKKLLDQYKAYHHWPVLNGMGAPTLDCIGCINGKFFAIETKRLGQKPTVRQERTIRDMQLAKGHAFVVDGSPESMTTLELWLKESQPCM